MVLAHVMDEVDEIISGIRTKIKYGRSHGQQHMLQKGLKIFGEHGYEALEKEIGQLDDRECFGPISVKEMSNQERRKAQVKTNERLAK